MTDLVRKLFLSVLLVLASGCGPGTGGTGGGGDSEYLWLAGAKATSVCSADFRALLRCPTEPMATEDRQGTRPIQYATVAPDTDLLVSFDASKVILQRGCPKLDYSGEFGVLPNGDGLFFGSYTAGGQIEHIAANLSIKADSATGQLVMELRATDDRLLLGPLTLKRVEVPREAPKACA
nr:hypothetical protein [uncultured Roseateles sp.]